MTAQTIKELAKKIITFKNSKNGIAVTSAVIVSQYSRTSTIQENLDRLGEEYWDTLYADDLDRYRKSFYVKGSNDYTGVWKQNHNRITRYFEEGVAFRRAYIAFMQKIAAALCQINWRKIELIFSNLSGSAHCDEALEFTVTQIWSVFSELSSYILQQEKAFIKEWSHLIELETSADLDLGDNFYFKKGARIAQDRSIRSFFTQYACSLTFYRTKSQAIADMPEYLKSRWTERLRQNWNRGIDVQNTFWPDALLDFLCYDITTGRRSCNHTFHVKKNIRYPGPFVLSNYPLFVFGLSRGIRGYLWTPINDAATEWAPIYMHINVMPTFHPAARSYGPDKNITQQVHSKLLPLDDTLWRINDRHTHNIQRSERGFTKFQTAAGLQATLAFVAGNEYDEKLSEYYGELLDIYKKLQQKKFRILYDSEFSRRATRRDIVGAVTILWQLFFEARIEMKSLDEWFQQNWIYSWPNDKGELWNFHFGIGAGGPVSENRFYETKPLRPVNVQTPPYKEVIQSSYSRLLVDRLFIAWSDPEDPLEHVLWSDNFCLFCEADPMRYVELFFSPKLTEDEFVGAFFLP